MGYWPNEGIMTTQYNLLAAGKKWKTRKEGTHLDHFLTALKALGGKATIAEVTEYCDQHKMKFGTMETRDAVGWVAAYAFRLDLCSKKEVSR
jgi:hypothetical protein